MHDNIITGYKDNLKTELKNTRDQPRQSPPTVMDHVASLNDRSAVCSETLCGTSLHRGLSTTSPQEQLTLGGPRPRASSPG